MVCPIENFAKFHTKLEDHHHHPHHDHQNSEEFSLSLKNFQSHVLNFINQLDLSNNSGGEVLSLTWIQRCFELLSFINKAFAEVTVNIDYPMSKWGGDSIEGYLSYTLNLLQVCNLISSSISHLGQARLSLYHGLSLVESSPSFAVEHLKEIQPKEFISKEFGGDLYGENEAKTIGSGKDWILHQALMVMMTVGCWISGVVLSALHSDSKPYIDMRKKAGGFENSPVASLDCRISNHILHENTVLKEVKEINDVVACLVAASLVGNDEAAKEMRKKLKGFEKQLDDFGREVDHLFQQVLDDRNELIDCLRVRDIQSSDPNS